MILQSERQAERGARLTDSGPGPSVPNTERPNLLPHRYPVEGPKFSQANLLQNWNGGGTEEEWNSWLQEERRRGLRRSRRIEGMENLTEENRSHRNVQSYPESSQSDRQEPI